MRAVVRKPVVKPSPVRMPMARPIVAKLLFGGNMPRIFAADSARPGWQGPERIETGWWEEDQQREYFRVRGRDGQWHWIYQDPLHPGSWFEHGLFG